jgi:hypothetical protein
VSAVYLAVDFQVKVFKRKGRTGAQVKAAILAAIAGYFRLYNTDGSKNTLIDFGYYIQDVDGEPAGSIPFSDMFNLIRDVDGVARIGDGSADFLVNGLRKDVTISARAFPKAGTVVIVDGDTGLTL